MEGDMETQKTRNVKKQKKSSTASRKIGIAQMPKLDVSGSSQLKSHQLENYREFFNYLLSSDDIADELVDDS